MPIERRVLTREQIMGLIPHRDPILFLQHAEILEPGIKAKGQLADLGDSRFDYLEGHFPGFRIFPGFFLAEGLAQLLSVAAQSGLDTKEDVVGVLTSADKWKWRGMVRLGDIIDLEAEVTRLKRFSRGDLRASGAGKVSATIGERSVAQGEIGFTVIARPKGL